MEDLRAIKARIEKIEKRIAVQDKLIDMLTLYITNQVKEGVEFEKHLQAEKIPDLEDEVEQRRRLPFVKKDNNL